MLRMEVGLGEREVGEGGGGWGKREVGVRGREGN